MEIENKILEQHLEKLQRDNAVLHTKYTEEIKKVQAELESTKVELINAKAEIEKLKIQLKNN